MSTSAAQSFPQPIATMPLPSPMPMPAPAPSPTPAGVLRNSAGEATSRGRSDDGNEPPINMENFDRITDFFMWDSDDPQLFADAWCAFDAPYARPIANTDVAEVMEECLKFIRTECKDAKHDDFQITLRDRYVFRVHRERTIGTDQLCLRRVTEHVPRLEELTLPPFWQEIFLSNTLLEGGLIVLSAKPGSGKSTTIAGTIRSRLEKFGGICKTVEAPPEFPLQNLWGRGVCYQIPVDETLPREDQFSKPIRGLMRGYPTGMPSILVVGEVRDKETAAECVRAAVGHLVITTMHAPDVESATRMLCGWAGQVYGEMVARDMVGSALRIVAQQRLERIKAPTAEGVWARRRVTGDLLFSRGGNTDIGNMIREGDFGSLLGKVKEQNRMLEKAAAAREEVDAFLDRLSPDIRKDGNKPL